MWKQIRILCLLLVLLVVAVNAYRDQNQDWSRPVVVLLHPVNADGRESTQRYIQQLSLEQLQDAQQYLTAAATQYRGQPVYFYFQLGREIQQLPPKVPENATMLQVIGWSLKFRYYAWQQSESADGSPSVRLFLNYYDPHHVEILKHSTALEKGRIGSVNLFASAKQGEQNKIVLVHELLHAFGASDKYDLTTGQPIYPVGYAEPEKQPLHPQRYAEIMSGHIAMSENQSKMAENLAQTRLNEMTATEIGWKK